MSRAVDIQEYMPVLIGLLAEGREVNMLVSGNSMRPFLADKRDTIIISPPDGSFSRGDMVFYRRENGQYIMHRVHHIGPDGGLYMVGDAQVYIEGPISREQVFGVVRKVIRKGKLVDQRDPGWAFFEKVWIRMVPLRPLIQKTYGRLKGK